MKQFTGSIMSLLFLVALATVAFAQQYQGGGPGPGPMMQDDQNLTPEQFKERKARALQMFEEREKQMTQHKACVEAATNAEELQKCRPQQMRRMGPGGGMRGWQGQQQPMGGGE